MARVDPARLESVVILLQNGMAPVEVRKALRVSRATLKRYRAEIRRIEIEAKALMKSDA